MGWDSILTNAELMFRDHAISAVLLITNNETYLVDVMNSFSGQRIILCTSKIYLKEKYSEKGIMSIIMESGEMEGTSLIKHLQRIVNDAILSGYVKQEDVLLGIFHDGISSILILPVNKIGITAIKDMMTDDVYITLSAVVDLLIEVAKQGREGFTLGALFTIGDEKKVLLHSTQLVINPFKGHPKEFRDVRKEDNKETFKEFSLIDGAFILDQKGISVSCGRLLETDINIDAHSGLGSRHMAALTITKKTDTVAAVLSTSGTIRIYKKGNCIYELSCR